MKDTIPITDLQSQSSQVVNGMSESMEEDLDRLDALEMLHLMEHGLEDFRTGRTLSQKEVRARLEKKASLL